MPVITDMGNMERYRDAICHNRTCHNSLGGTYEGIPRDSGGSSSPMTLNLALPISTTESLPNIR